MLFLGIDWSDDSLEYFLRDQDKRELVAGRVKPDFSGMAELFSILDKHAAAGQIGVAIETCHGAWVQAFLDQGYRVYPVNPAMAESHRKSLCANGDKTDKIDARVLSHYLLTFLDKMRALAPDDPEVVSLRIACMDRVRLVQERTAKTNELNAILKCHYPAFLGLFGDIDSGVALEFLRDFPTQNAMRKLKEKKLRKWLQRAGYSCPGRIDQMITKLQ
jgi:transposase